MSTQDRTGRSATGLCVLLALVVLSAAGAAAAQGTASPSEGVARVGKFAPPGLAGAAYVDIAAIRKKFDEQITAEQRDKAKPVRVMLELAKKIDWVGVILPAGFQRLGPLIVLHGKLTAADMSAFAAAVENKKVEFQKGANGRYDAKGRLTIIVGNEADDVPADIALLGNPKLLTAAFLAGLGKAKSETLDKLLSPVDTAAPVWLAMTFPRRPGRRSEARSLFVSGYPLGEKASQITLECADEESAEEVAKGFTGLDRSVPSLKGLTRVTRDGLRVQLRIKPDKSLPHKLVAAVIEARRRAQEALSASNLRQISIAVMTYSADNRATLPLRLGELAKYLATPDVFVSPLSGRKPPKFGKGKLVGETDYLYILEAVKPSGAKPPKPIRLTQVESPSELVLVYERPENYGKRGTAVAFLDGHVEFLSTEKFKAALERTRKELKRIGW